VISVNKNKIILVVDDSSANLQLCRGLLGGEYDVRLVKSGKIALEALTRIKPDIILLDIEMPGMSGFDVITELNADSGLRAIPVIFVTSHATEKLVAKAAELGASDYVVKPVEAGVLRGKIRNCLKKRRIDVKITV